MCALMTVWLAAPHKIFTAHTEEKLQLQSFPQEGGKLADLANLERGQEEGQAL